MTTISSYSSANRGPLTTIYTPPASCLSQTTLVSHLTSVSSISGSKQFLTTKIFANHFSWGDSSCYPPTIATVDGTTRWNDGYYYSPGICPSGWSSACQQRTILAVSGFTNVLDVSTTGILCCPSNWSCVGGATTLAAHGCSIALTAGQTLSSVWLAPTPATDLVIPTNPALVSWTISSNTSALCDAIPVLWQNTDLEILALLTSTPSVSTATSLSTSVQQTSSTREPTYIRETGSSSIISTAASSPKSSGLSTGAKAAIGVVIPLVIIAAVIGIFLLMRRHKTRSLDHNRYELAGYPEEKYDTKSANRKDIVEADAGNHSKKDIFEADAENATATGIAEADAGNAIMEMGATDDFMVHSRGIDKLEKDRVRDDAVYELPTDEIQKKK